MGSAPSAHSASTVNVMRVRPALAASASRLGVGGGGPGDGDEGDGTEAEGDGEAAGEAVHGCSWEAGGGHLETGTWKVVRSSVKSLVRTARVMVQSPASESSSPSRT